MSDQFIGIKVNTNGEINVINEDITKDMCDNIRTHIGGYMELVNPLYCGLPNDWRIVVDEEGSLKQKELNLIASTFYGFHVHGVPIVGDVMFCKIGYVNDGVGIIQPNEEDIKEVESIISNIRDGIYNIKTKH